LPGNHKAGFVVLAQASEAACPDLLLPLERFACHSTAETGVRVLSLSPLLASLEIQDAIRI
jgi:hypothetical protein